MIIENNQILVVYMANIRSTKYDTICYIAKNSDIVKLDPRSLKWPLKIQELIDTEYLTVDI